MDTRASRENGREVERYLPYVQALAELRRRLDATPDELAGWVYFGPKDGGLAAYLNANELDSPPRFYFDFMVQGPAFDYIAPLMACWFSESDISSFEPDERFLSGADLARRWGQYPDIRVWPYIRAKITESRLLPFHPIYGGTRCMFPSQTEFPPDENGIFLLSEVEAIEDSELKFAAGRLGESIDGSIKLPGEKEDVGLTVAALEPADCIDASNESAGEKGARKAVDAEREVGGAEIGSPEWRAEVARKGAEAVHSRAGGSREKKAILLGKWATGHYTTKERCAEEEGRALGISIATALRHLRKAPPPVK